MVPLIKNSNSAKPLYGFNSLVQRLEEKEEIEQKIQALHKQITTLEETRNHFSRTILQLEGRGKSSYASIEWIVRIFFSLWNRKSLKVQKSYHDLFDRQLKQKKQELVRQNAQINQLTENILHRLKRLDHKLPPLIQQEISLINEKNISAIFNLENRLRLFTSDNQESAQVCLRTYRQVICPLVSQAKIFLRQRNFNYIAHAAAEHGKASHAYFKAIPQLCKTDKLLKHNAGTHQKVILNPHAGVVFKNTSLRAKEEGKLISQLFAFYNKQGGVLGSFSVKGVLQKYGYGLSILNDQERKRLVPLSSSSNKLIENIKARLTLFLDKLIVYSTINPMTNSVRQEMSLFKNMDFYINKSEEGVLKRVSFKKLKRAYIDGKVSPDSQLGYRTKEEGFKIFNLAEAQRDRSPIYEHLNRLELDPSLMFACLPDLSDPQDKEAYEQCESLMWQYQDAKDNWHCSSFYDIHHLSLLGYVFKQLLPVDPLNRIELFQDSITKALNVPWKLVPSTALRLSSSSYITDLKNYQVTPYIDNLIRLNQLRKFSKAISIVFSKLTPTAEFNAILTGLFQFLDLHGDNIGLRPILKVNYQNFAQKSFYLANEQKVNFVELLLFYLDGEIFEDDYIQWEEGEQTIREKMGELLTMKNALKIRWEFVFYDTDLSIGENSMVQFQVRKGQQEYLIPIRSALLGLAWKDQRLQSDTIQLLLDSEHRDLHLKNWIERLDSPIRRQLSAEAQQIIDGCLTPLLKELSLNNYRQLDADITIADLRAKFIEEITNESKYSALWGYLTTEISFQSNRTIQEWEAKKKWVAAQLFPRLTKSQSEALMERLTHMRKYLRDYQELSHLNLEGEELLEALSIYINQVETPLDSYSRTIYLNRAGKIKQSDSISIRAFKLHQRLLKDCEPTYFNLMQVMYPLLKDTFTLYEVTIKNFAICKKKSQYWLSCPIERLTGESIGAYYAPLDEAIEIAKNKFPQTDKYHQLALKLEEQIANCENPSYFGDWS